MPRTRSSGRTLSGFRDDSSLLETAVLWVVAVCIAALSASTVLPRAAGDLAADCGASLDRMLDDVAVLASEPHPMGSPGLERVRGHLIGELEAVGLAPQMQTVSVPDYFGSPGRSVDATNVMVRIRGTGDGSAILVMAHYDTVPATKGANDNSAAVAALLEASRVLSSAPPLRNDVILLFTDGEEPAPRFGANAFATEHPWFEDVRVAVNLEAIGSSGPDLLLELTGPDRVMLDAVAGLSSPVAFSFFTTTAELIGGASTDFDVVRAADLPGLNFAWLRGSAIYHSGDDDLDHLNTAGLANHASHAIGLVTHFGDADLQLAGSSGSEVFFSVPGGLLVRHPAVWVPTGAGIIAVVLAAGLALSIRRRPFRWSPILRGVGWALLGMLGAGLAGTLLWMAISSVRWGLGVVEAYGWLVALLVVAGGSWAMIRRQARNRHAAIGDAILLVWVAVALVTSFTVPTIGYLFVWPALAGTIAFALRSATQATFGWRLASMVIVAVPTFFLITPAIDAFFLLATPRPGNPDSELPSMIVVPLILVYLVIGLTSSAAEKD